MIAYDTTTKVGKLILTLPPSQYSSATTQYGLGVVQMHEHPAQPGRLAIAGVFGDLVVVDPDRANGHAAPKVLSHAFTGVQGSATTTTSNLVNSFHYDPSCGDWVVGSRDGHVERWVDGHSAEKIIPNVGGGALPASNSVTGIHHLPVANHSDLTYGAGCPGPGGYTPTDVAVGAAVPGNAAFALALYSGTSAARVLLAIGLSNTVYNSSPLPMDLTPLGAPGCALRVAPVILLGAALGGTGSGAGMLTIPLALPAGLPKGIRIHRQWAMDMSAAPTNAAGFVLSNARTIWIQ